MKKNVRLIQRLRKAYDQVSVDNELKRLIGLISDLGNYQMIELDASGYILPTSTGVATLVESIKEEACKVFFSDYGPGIALPFKKVAFAKRTDMTCGICSGNTVQNNWIETPFGKIYLVHRDTFR